MAFKDNFFEITPENRFAEKVYKQLDRIMEAYSDEEFLKQVNKLEALIWVGTDNQESTYPQDNKALIERYNNRKKNNPFGLARARLKLLMNVIDGMSLIGPDEVTTAINPKLVQDVALPGNKDNNAGEGQPSQILPADTAKD
jgi:hypothetical protein